MFYKICTQTASSDLFKQNVFKGGGNLGLFYNFVFKVWKIKVQNFLNCLNILWC